MIRPHRQHPLWIAFLVHRLSGILLALFLPFHFLVLGLALKESAALDEFLHWSDQPLVKFGEIMLVFLLTIHLFGGLRLLAMEWLPWSNQQKTLAALASAGAGFIALIFLLQVV